MQLKYGCNPHQKFASAEPLEPGNSPLEIIHGNPGYINILDALNAWQLVSEAKVALGLAAAASFKHVSPAGAAVATPLPEDLAKAYEVVGKNLTPVATAYIRARGADPKSSYGDFVAVSDRVDEATAEILKGAVSDGIVAPDYDPAALQILTAKKGGGYLVLRAKPGFQVPERESREVLGMRLTQDRNSRPVTRSLLDKPLCGQFTDAAKRDLILAMITMKYTQSNSVGYALDGQMIGIGAGQQSRVDCTKLAGGKSDVWHLGRHPKVLNLQFKKTVKRPDRINFRVRYIEGDLLGSELEALKGALDQPYEPLSAEEKRDWIERELKGVSLASDGFFPFRDNIDHAARHGVKFIAQPGGSTRDDEVIQACQEHGMAMAHTGVRLFHH